MEDRKGGYWELGKPLPVGGVGAEGKREDETPGGRCMGAWETANDDGAVGESDRSCEE